MSGPGSRDVTIYDVARAAGVAPSTVSRAFSRPGRVNAATAERIRKVADELGYRANPLARALPTARTPHDRAGRLRRRPTPSTPRSSGARRRPRREAGYTILLADAQESDRRGAGGAGAGAADGRRRRPGQLADVGLGDPDDRQAEADGRAQPGRRGRARASSPTTPAATRRAVEHLVAAGARRRSPTSPGRRRPGPTGCAGGRCRTRRRTCSCGSAGSARSPPTCPAACAPPRSSRRQPATAVVAYNDQLAIGLIRGLAARGRRGARDVSVVGFDNIGAAELVTPGPDDGRGAAARSRAATATQAPARHDRGRAEPAPARRWSCRSGSSNADRRLSAAGRAPRRPRGRRTSRRRPRNASMSTAAGSR